jgi:predicted neuraminidase|tara:strand:+ start:278 stop:1354 length:1077 start_codon:yes stop_codon:yes gene_type:complete
MKDHKPKPSHHASSICEISSGQFLVSWFAGQFESKPDVGIYTARYQNGKWSAPELVVHPKGVPTWNPVLFKRSNGDLFLFYKHGRTPANWKGYYVKSRDGGNTWSSSVAMPNGIVGPAKNKPLELDDGTILLPSSREFGARGKDWEIVVEAMTMEDEFKTYAKFAVSEKGGGASVQQRVIQPVFWKQSMLAGDAANGIRMMARSRSSYAVAAVGDSTGRIWTDAVFSQIPCPNTGFDVVKLRDGRLLIVYNHSFKHAIAGRGVLALAVSHDDGDTWERVMRLEDSGGRLLEFSYPAIIQASDGMVHVTYTWRRANIKHVIIDPSKIPTARDGKKQGSNGEIMFGGFEKLPKSITREIV